MRHRIVGSLLALGTMYALTSLTAFGMVTNGVRVNVPFSFVVEKTVLPAGRYVIRPVDPANPNILTIRSENGRKSVIVVTEPVTATDKTPQSSELLFQKVGNREYLSQIWENGAYDGSEIPGVSTKSGDSHSTRIQSVPAAKS